MQIWNWLFFNFFYNATYFILYSKNVAKEGINQNVFGKGIFPILSFFSNAFFDNCIVIHCCTSHKKGLDHLFWKSREKNGNSTKGEMQDTTPFVQRFPDKTSEKKVSCLVSLLISKQVSTKMSLLEMKCIPLT